MAKKSLRDLRREHDAAEARGLLDKPAGDAPAEGVPKKKAAAKKKAPGTAKPRAKKAAKNVRKRLVWVVYDNSNKPIAKFPYTQRKEADEKAEQMKADKKTTYFVQPVKEDWPVEE
ncbi:MAG: hypothetical protein K2W96_25285 [Gemmataceae bacterium]|nr:hypothetical protein [Gemmataceae bacterium]